MARGGVRKVAEDGTYQRSIRHSGGNKFRVQTYQGRIGKRGVSIHRFDEGSEVPWCHLRNHWDKTKKSSEVYRTDESVNCKLCINDTRFA